MCDFVARVMGTNSALIIKLRFRNCSSKISDVWRLVKIPNTYNLFCVNLKTYQTKVGRLLLDCFKI